MAVVVRPTPEALALVLVLAAASGCMIGPDYAQPDAPTAARWREADHEKVADDSGETPRWWEIFRDPVLERLVQHAYEENLTLRAAGMRVIAAQARRGIAVGGLFPQTQELNASYTRTQLSDNNAQPALVRSFDAYIAGFDAAWELDLWGKFRRAVQASDAELHAAIADYDAVLVSLVAEVAATYVQLRVLDERIALARSNVDVQRDSLRVASVRFEAGGTSELDVQQARTLLADTEATIPQLEAQRRTAEDALSVLLGMPPSDLSAWLGEGGGIPAAPVAIAVGIPAELLRRRPDVRRAERAVAAQSARIGVAKADLLPRFQLVGQIGFGAEEAAELFQGRSFAAFGGPRFDWPVLNYGRLINAVRVQDATFQELANAYAQTVLAAQQEVENALAGYLRGAEQTAHLARSVAAANRAVDLSIIQYREGAADYTRVLTTQQAKLREDDLLTVSRGSVTLSAIALYKALGGGWELREDAPFVAARTTP
jgi:NodT family efflux transporter outer membrane factor (OMF) lipoprotein